MGMQLLHGLAAVLFPSAATMDRVREGGRG